MPGGPQNLSQGGVVIDNNVTPGCESPNLDCFPYAWKTYAEFLEDAGVSWQVVSQFEIIIFFLENRFDFEKHLLRS